MGIPAFVKLPKSMLVLVAVYVLCSAIDVATKALQRSRSLSIPRFWPLGLSSSASRASPAVKGGRVTGKALMPNEFGEFSRKGRLEQGGVFVCVVCLGDVREGEEIRELRECLHAFHKDCLDGWVEEGHCTCPLCRTEFLFDGNV